MDQPYVICRRAEHSLEPGYTLGYQCISCGRDLQVSPSGVPMIRQGGIPLCNPCGLEFAKEASKAGTLSRPTVISPAAARTLARLMREQGLE